MARVRFVINGVTASYVEVPIGVPATIQNDGDGDETTILWVSFTGSQPSGAFDGFADPLDFSTTFTPRKEGSYLLNAIVDSSVTGSAILAVRHLKTDLRAPAAAETTEESGSFGWARALQNIHDYVDDVSSAGSYIVGLAFHNLNRGDLVRPSGSSLIKEGFHGEERAIEFRRIAGEPTGSFQNTLFIVEGTQLSGTFIKTSGSRVDNPRSGSLFIARMQGLFGPITSSTPVSIGSPIFPRSDGVLATQLDVVDRKVGTILGANSASFFVHFDGASGLRALSAGAGGGSTTGSIKVALTGAELAQSPFQALNFTGSRGVVIDITQANSTASINISGAIAIAKVANTGTLIDTPVQVINFSGTSGIVTSVSVSNSTASVNFVDSGIKRFRWIVDIESETSDVQVTIPQGGMGTDQYVVVGTVSSITGSGNLFAFYCPEEQLTDRTKTDFRVVTSNPVMAGDAIDFIVMERTASDDFIGPGGS